MPLSKSKGKRPSSAGVVSAEILLKEFKFVGQLGVGAFGSVYKAVHAMTKYTVAIKKIEVNASYPAQSLADEISLIRDLDNQHIVKYLGSFFVKPHLNIVMEYCEAGSVADIMRLRRKTMQEKEIATILQGTLQGLQYMHSKRHVHRDIKSGNVLLAKTGTVKLADFGVAGQLSETTQKRKTVIGSPFWMAPEVIQEIGHDSMADLWSLGILAIEMAEGKPPHADIHPMRAIFRIAQNEAPTFKDPSMWGDPFRTLLSKCLVKDPRKRASAKDLLKLPFIKTAKPPGEVLAKVTADAIKIMDEKLKRDGTLAEIDELGGNGGGNKGASAGEGSSAAAGATTLSGGSAGSSGSTIIGGGVDLGTLVIHDDEDIPADEKPAFLKHYEEAAAREVVQRATKGASGSGSSTPTILTQDTDLDDLRERLEVLAGKRGSVSKKSPRKRPSST